jgi:alpha-galactosidase
MTLNRRQFSLAALSASTGAGPHWTAAPPRAIAMDGSAAAGIRIGRRWQGPLCRTTLTNVGPSAVPLKEIVLFEGGHGCPGGAAIYGEGFTMLSQTGGTLAQPASIGGYTDKKHYRIPEPEDATTVYNFVCLSPPGGHHTLLGFTSSHRWVGRIHLRPGTLQVTVDCEGLTLAPGERWQLEEFCRLEGKDRAALFDEFARHIAAHHPRLAWPAPPEGWCSWYCFGPRVTAQQVMDNLEWIAKNAPNLRYIQIDDGYQPAMGDWLETGTAFGGDIRTVLKQIRERGFEPAIWVAPFIAEEKSHVFERRPEWFMKGGDGKPLASNKVTFGGWRRGPWYALDATHPEARKHLEALFRTMNQEWGVTYFKLDANFWGAMHGARLYDPRATRVEAYRRGMEAVLKGAGKSFVLGCNHPLWPSLGLIHGSRSSGDISRRWTTVKKVAWENLHRAWQNGALWWNDPDALVLMGNLPENEFLFHAAATFATGGMLLSGDDLTRITPERKALLGKLRPAGQAAAFDPEFRLGRMKLAGREILFALNWEDAPQAVEIPLARPAKLRDFFSGEDLGTHRGTYRTSLAGRSARVLEAQPA